GPELVEQISRSAVPKVMMRVNDRQVGLDYRLPMSVEPGLIKVKDSAPAVRRYRICHCRLALRSGSRASYRATTFARSVAKTTARSLEYSRGRLLVVEADGNCR